MNPGFEQGKVREYTRLACSIEAILSVAERHAAQIVFSASCADGNGCVRATVIDCSAGGLGIETSTFIPRRAALSVTIQRPADGGDPLRFLLVVRRVAMVARAPTYYLGTAVADGDPAQVAALTRLMGIITPAQASTSPVPAAGGAVA